MLQTATIMQDKDTIYEIMMHRILLKIKTVTISINLVVNSYIVAVTTIRNWGMISKYLFQIKS